MNCKIHGRKLYLSNLRSTLTLREGAEENYEISIEGNRPSGREFNSGRPEYGEVISTGCSIFVALYQLLKL
jgi:hypothetical protein